MITVTNKHGVQGVKESIGNHFISSNGSTSMFVPLICTNCDNYDPGEYGDYGSKLSPPYCEANVWFPTRTGTCGKYRRR